MLPLIRFKDLLTTYKAQIDEDLDELIMAAEIIGTRPNYVLMDEHGYYHVQTSGHLEEVIINLRRQLEKLERIQVQKDTQ